MSVLAFLAVAAGLPAAAPAAAGPLPVAGAVVSAPTGSIGTMACYGPKSCIGLGAFTQAQSAEYYLQTWDGSRWGPVFGEFPNSGNYALSSIWCSSATYCVAAGSTNANGAAAQAPLTATWNGRTWSASKPPNPTRSPQWAWFNGISCASAKFCVAVGDYTWPWGNSGPVNEGFADMWNGTKWTLTRKLVARPGAITSNLYDVSCPSAGSCVAAGGSYVPYTSGTLADPTAVAVTEMWNGRKWTQVNASAPARGHGQLTDVSCWSGRGCVAVGYYYRHNSTLTSNLAESWNGRRWTAVTPFATGNSPDLNGVSCTSAVSCLAVGTGNDGPNRTPIRAIADSWNGRSWKAVPVATPPRGSGSHNGYELAVVKCASAANCVATGLAGPFHGQGIDLIYPFAELWSGKSLKVISDS